MSPVFMYEERDKNTNSQTNGSIKYISNTHDGMMQNEIYCKQRLINMYFRVRFRILNRSKTKRV